MENKLKNFSSVDHSILRGDASVYLIPKHLQ